MSSDDPAVVGCLDGKKHSDIVKLLVAKKEEHFKGCTACQIDIALYHLRTVASKQSPPSTQPPPIE